MANPIVIHISADYPDAVRPSKTRAIAALVEGTADRFEHRVYSLNRDWNGAAAWLRPGRVEAAADDGRVASWRYSAPACGAMLASSMDRVADAVMADLRARDIRPALIHGHKLSFEGLAAQRVAAMLGAPYALTVQGNTDQKVVSVRRDLAPRYRRAWGEAACVIAFAPWAARWCAERLGERAGPTLALPCIPSADAILPPRRTGPRVVSAFHLVDWRNKNVAALAHACAGLRERWPDMALEIAGAGPLQARAAVDGALASRAIGCRIGAVPIAGIQAWMNGAALFAMPSLRESFGMVYVEALLAGCPIVYPRGAAVDGYFDGAPFALAVDARDPASIGRAVATLLAENVERKAALAAWQASGAAERFRRPAILDAYAAATTAALR